MVDAFLGENLCLKIKKIQNLFLNEEKVEDLIRRYYSDIYKYCFFSILGK